ncbi:hypothetical protein K523DRAFT_288152 [Schizophyllum commune Tattone D]|nr:hypothetical protein K523DRAFT_288152 [Schizophyllum commune Tattone D]
MRRGQSDIPAQRGLERPSHYRQHASRARCRSQRDQQRTPPDTSAYGRAEGSCRDCQTSF